MGALLLLALVVTMSTWTSTARAQDYAGADVHLVGRVLFTSHSGGHFADPACHEEGRLAPSDFARYTARLATEEQRFGVDALILDTGGLLAPDGVARFTAFSDPDAYAEMVAGIGYEALAFGEPELGAPREGILAVARSLRERGIPLIASNLRCDEEAAALCEVIVDAEDGVPLFEVGEQQVAVLAFLDPGLTTRVAPDRASGIRLAPIAESIDSAVREARRRGADTVIAILDDGGSEGAVARALELATELPAEGEPDLLMVADGGGQMLFARPADFRPAIAAAPPSGSADLHVRRNEVSGTYDVLVQPFSPAEEPAPAVMQWIERVGDSYCERMGQRLPGGNLAEPMSASDFLTLSAGVAREAAHAEVALINRGLIDSNWRPAREDGLTASAVFVALQYDEPLVRARVDGRWLQEVARRSADNPDLLALGISIDKPNTIKEKIKINGHAFEVRGTYEVVTLRFLAQGGDGLLPEGPDWQPVGDATIRTAMLDYLRVDDPRDPRERLPDLTRHAQWTLDWQALAGYGGSSVENAADYGDSQFDWQNTASFNLESTTVLNAVARLWEWDNQFVIRYRTARVETEEFAEGSDVVSWRTNGMYREFRDRQDEFYIPDLFIENYLESELSQDEERDFWHLLIRPTAGLHWRLTAKLIFRINGGFEYETLDPMADPLAGVGFQAQLKPWTLMQEGDRKVIWEFGVDYFCSGLGDLNRQTLRTSSTLSFNLTRAFGFALTSNTFAVHESGNSWSIASNVSAALRLAWIERRAH